MATAIKARFPLLLLLLGIVFLALVCVSSGIAQYEQGNPRHNKCLQRCNRVNEASRRRECHSHCEEWPQEEEEDERPRHKEPGRRERGHQEGGEQEEERQPRHPRREREQEEEEERQHRQPQRKREEEDEEEREHVGHRSPRREREEEEEERPRREREEEQRPRQRGRGREEEEEGEEERRGSRRREDPEERERLRRRRERRGEQEEGESESRSEREERRRRRREHEEEEGSSSSSRGRKNPFFFRSNRFQTLFENENGRIRLLQRFDKRSNLFQNLQNYRLVEYRTKPHTLLLPQHTDADFILVVLSGKAILTVVNPDDRNSFNLERGDAIKIPAGTIAYLANRDDDEDLRVVDLAIPVNRPGQFQSFFPSNQNQQSYFHGFSKDILEASLNTKYEEIERVLLEEQQEQEQGRQQRRGRRERQQSQEANDPIVKVSREQIEELSKNAKSSSKKSKSSKSEPFNLRSRSPIYSNKFGKFFEITPEKNPQLQDLNLFISSVEIREGALLVPHYNSRAFVILVVNEGKGQLELVAQRNEQQQEQGEEEEEDEQQEQQEEDERSRQVQRYRARLSPGDVFIIPSSHPVAVNASSDLSLIGFGINAENNQRNFLAGEDDNVISQIHRPVKELSFPGSAKEVDRLFDNQKQSHFANAQPQQREEGSQRRRSPLSSILGAFY